MKLKWGRDKKSIILIAETIAEIAFAEIFVEGMNVHRYAETKTTAKWSLLPEEIE